jgi:periplasmic divalent cation tolerance protein
MKTLMGYATFKNATEAKKICTHLLEKKLIACANIFAPHTAIYEWLGKPVHSKEVTATFKTQKKHTKAIIKTIEELHSYDVPCVVFWPLGIGAKNFMSWIQTQTEKQNG